MWGSKRDTEIANLKRRLERLESQMTYLFRKSGIECEPPPRRHRDAQQHQETEPGNRSAALPCPGRAAAALRTPVNVQRRVHRLRRLLGRSRRLRQRHAVVMHRDIPTDRGP